ncbi:Phage protein [Sinorhizobium fredii CCBAU 25509]|nr:Phage protein [Sinorhizobium fredii CCBAU 25509]
MRNNRREVWQTWQAIRQKLGGRSGLIAVRVRSSLSAPYVSGQFEPVIETEHGDDSPFDDETPYTQGAISVVTDGVTAVGATSIRLRIINADANLVGTRFSYNHALYETGPVTEVDGDIWTVPISPSVRELIPAGADLEFDQPTCLCHLAEDRGMDVDQNAVSKFVLPSVSFVEAVDYWSGL